MTETPDQKRTRRRWLNLAELVAVAGLIIAALGLWANWSERRADKAEQAQARATETRDKARVELTGTVASSGDVLKLADEKHDISEATIAYPRALGLPVQHPPGEPVVDAAPFAGSLLKLTDGGADDRTGRLPALITVRWVDGDVTRQASGIYDVTWRTRGRWPRGRALALTGLRLRQRGGGQAAVDAAWAREKP